MSGAGRPPAEDLDTGPSLPDAERDGAGRSEGEKAGVVVPTVRSDPPLASTGVVPAAARGPRSGDRAEQLAVEGVSAWFGEGPARVVAIDGVDLAIPRGRFVTLIGPSGCGKSTLLRIVAGLREPQRGRVSVFGRTPERAREDKLIGFVPQTPSLLPWRTVLENVTLTLEVNRQADQLALDPVELLGSFGLGDALGLRPRQLSGGMQQRVAIARALVFSPSLLVMDEPFSALDELTRERQRLLLLDVWERRGTTVLFVTHSVPEAVALSDTVVVMSRQPGAIRTEIPIDLPRPRPTEMESSAAFHRLEQLVRGALREGWHGSP